MSKTCQNCNSILSDNHKFCTKCGTKIVDKIEENIIPSENKNNLNKKENTRIYYKIGAFLILIAIALFLSLNKSNTTLEEVIEITKYTTSNKKDIPSTLPNTYTKEQLEKMIGKMVMLGFHGQKIDSDDKIYKDIKKYDLGGVILFDKDPNNKKKTKNINNPEQLKNLTKQLQAINKEKLLISIDQEGGIVQRLKESQGFINTPKASAISRKGEVYAQNAYSELAKVLKKSGLNVNYAPIVDLNINPNNPVIAKLGRSFGKSSKEVIKYASIFTKEMKKENIISVLKHFPGHGSSQSDSHKGFVDITKTWQKEELEPYMYFIKNGLVDMIMSANIVNKNLDYSLPATLSWNINTKLLRHVLGYKGVLISDDLQMYAISKHYNLDDTLKLAINSGVDMLMFANQYAKPIKLETIIDSVYKQVRSGEIKMHRIKEANRRIGMLKIKL